MKILMGNDPIRRESGVTFQNQHFSDQNKLLKNYVEIGFPGITFINCDFEDIFLGSSVFGRCHFQSCTLTNVFSRKATFSGCNFRDCCFKGGEFRRADFYDSSFENCDFVSVDLLGSDFNSCQFKKTRFFKSAFFISVTDAKVWISNEWVEIDDILTKMWESNDWVEVDQFSSFDQRLDLDD
jgi:uncharacterized protein YjbI with pentapeptide repeats